MSMAMLNSYVSLPEGKSHQIPSNPIKPPSNPMKPPFFFGFHVVFPWFEAGRWATTRSWWPRWSDRWVWKNCTWVKLEGRCYQRAARDPLRVFCAKCHVNSNRTWFALDFLVINLIGLVDIEISQWHVVPICFWMSLRWTYQALVTCGITSRALRFLSSCQEIIGWE